MLSPRYQFIKNCVISVLMCLWWLTPAAASTVVTINQASIAVTDQSQKTQTAAAKQALEQVFIKMTGQRQIVSNPVLRQAINSPQQYLRSYRFDMEAGQLHYVAEFDFQVLSNLLKDEALPIWGQRRPDTLFWLAVEEEDGSKQILDDSTQRPVTSTLRDIAKERAVPVSFPIMDLDDSLNLTVYDIWGRFAQRLKTASVRYNPDYIVGARIYKVKENSLPDIEEERQTREQAAQLKFSSNRPAFAGNGLQDLSQYLVDDLVEEVSDPAFSRSEFEEMSNRITDGAYALDWVVISANDIEFGSLYDDDKTALATLFLEEYADYLGKHFSIIPTGEDVKTTDIVISVANIDSLPKYVDIQTYLSDMSMVSRVTLVQQQGSVATLAVSLLADTRDFYNLIALDSRLKPVADRTGKPVDGLNFYWNN